MKKIILILILFCSCTYDSYIGCIENYFFNEDIQVYTFEDCFNWTKYNIKYLKDIKNYVQTPEETYNLKTGNCDDLCLMTMYLLYKIGYDSIIVVVKVLNNKYNHAIIKIDNHYYESTSYNNIDSLIGIKYFLKNQELDYCKAIWEAVNYHYLYTN